MRISDWSSDVCSSDLNSSREDVVRLVRDLTDSKGVDAAIEAVGVPATFGLCEELVAPGGVIANVGVHGTKVDLHLEELWSRNVTITTRLFDTVSTPMLLKTVESKRLQPEQLVDRKSKRLNSSH